MPGSRLFAAIYDKCSGGAEGYMAPRREYVAGGAKGRVLEIGAGTGGNLPYYRVSQPGLLPHPSPRPKGTRLGEGVTSLTLTDVSAHMLKRLTAHAEEQGFAVGSSFKSGRPAGAAGQAPSPLPSPNGQPVEGEGFSERPPVRLVQASAESLPFEDGSFDTVTGTLVLCSVRDQPKALSEVRRVLRPGGEFRFFEHVRSDRRCWGLFQRAVKPLWGVIGDGCDPHPKPSPLQGEGTRGPAAAASLFNTPASCKSRLLSRELNARSGVLDIAFRRGIPIRRWQQ